MRQDKRSYSDLASQTPKTPNNDHNDIWSLRCPARAPAPARQDAGIVIPKKFWCVTLSHCYSYNSVHISSIN